jgi:RNA polymerase sigma-70 factor (ECF subfamily)
MDRLSNPLYQRMLVLRCQTGDERALFELVQCYQPRLAYFVGKMLGRPEGVDDLLQDVWLEVIRGLPRLKDAAAFPAWVYRIARDRVYREIRRRGQAHPIDDVEEPVVDPADDDQVDAGDAALVHACLDQISPKHREVPVLRFLEDMSYQEVARIAGCDVGTVRSRLHYAKQSLRNAMERRRHP